MYSYLLLISNVYPPHLHEERCRHVYIRTRPDAAPCLVRTVVQPGTWYNPHTERRGSADANGPLSLHDRSLVVMCVTLCMRVALLPLILLQGLRVCVD